MVLCNNCQVMMIPTMSFSQNGNKKYSRCPRCYAETKKQRLDRNELSFGEYLNKAAKNRGYYNERNAKR